MRRFRHIFFALPLLAAACTSPEQRFANDASKLFPGGETDFAHMCGAIGEIAYENMRRSGSKQLLAQVASTSLVEETEETAGAKAQLYLNASGYLRTPVRIECRFDKTRLVASRWYPLEEMRIEGKAVSERALANINATGVSLAGARDNPPPAEKNR